MEEQQQTAPKEASRQSPGKMLAYGALSIVLLGAAGVGVWAFRATRALSDRPSVVRFAKITGISVAKVNGISVPYADYVEDVALLKKFYGGQEAGGQPQPSDVEISDQVLSRLIVNALIARYADTYGVAVSDADVQASPLLEELVAPFGTREAAEAEMQKRYGLSFDAYVAKVMKPVMIEQKLSEAFAVSADDTGKEYAEEQVRASHILLTLADPKEDAAVKAAAQKVLDRAKAGEDFAALAKEFGSDGTKDAGGDLGWFGRGQMVQAFEDAVFAVAPGMIPELVKTDFGYHIVRVDEKRTARNYAEFMGDQLRSAKVAVLISSVHNPFETPVPAAGDAVPADAEANGASGQ
jgi:parvulin-like peptidyl-prolyl isomerase